VYESYVKPKEKITNYLTQFSGITEEKLQDVTTTLEDVQETLVRLLPEDSIWIGQSLNCDLHALKVKHNSIFKVTCNNLFLIYLDDASIRD
jgi:RNA exonuclease 1